MRVSSLNWGFAAVVAALAAGCGTSASSICSEVCDCTGCSEEEEADCVDDVEDQQKEAEDEGCADQADELLACYGDQLECRDSEVDLDGCDAETRSLANCMGSASGRGSSTGSSGPGRGPGRNVCEEAFELCGTDGSGVDCSGATECQSTCIVDAGQCDAADEVLYDCLEACTGGSPAPSE